MTGEISTKTGYEHLIRVVLKLKRGNFLEHSNVPCQRRVPWRLCLHLVSYISLSSLL